MRLGKNRVIGWLDTSNNSHRVRLEHLLEPPGALYYLEVLDDDGAGQDVVSRRYVMLRDSAPNSECVVSIEESLPLNGDPRFLRPYRIPSVILLDNDSAQALEESFEQQRRDDPASLCCWKRMAQEALTAGRLQPPTKICKVLRHILDVLADFKCDEERGGGGE